MSLIDMVAIFASSGISRREVLSYSLPYVSAVLPKVMERQLAAINPLALAGLGGAEPEANVKMVSKNKVPTVSEINAAMANLSF